MIARKTPDDATLLDVLVDGFEKNEVLDGFHWRQLPMLDEKAARAHAWQGDAMGPVFDWIAESH